MMNTLEFYNEAERRITWALTQEQLENVGQWINNHFQHNPDDKDLLREDLGRIYKHRKSLLREESRRQATIYLKQWAARQITKTPRELQVEILQETDKAYLIKGHALSTPTTHCRHCGRKLTHPVSVLYGIGPECGKHYHIPNNPEDVEVIKTMIEQIQYEGWIPKSGVQNINFL